MALTCGAYPQYVKRLILVGSSAVIRQVEVEKRLAKMMTTTEAAVSLPAKANRTDSRPASECATGIAFYHKVPDSGFLDRGVYSIYFARWPQRCAGKERGRI